MASEDPHVAFSYAQSQTPVRLLELPPALLSLISADPAPILKIKASSPPSGPTPSSSTNHAVLCTSSETYFLRHVHSSNSVFLLGPRSTGGVAAVSTASSYLELLPTSPDPVPLLEKHLRPYYGREDDDESEKHRANDDEEVTLPRIELQNDLPISDCQFDAAWRECVAFELNGIPSRPVSSVILKTLSVVSTAATAEGLSLTKNFTLQNIIYAVDDTDIPSLLIHAVITRVCDQQDGGNEWILNIERCAHFVGKTVLQDWSEQHEGLKAKNDLLYISFMNKWKSAAPDACVKLCQLELLKGWYTLPTPNTIRYVPTGDAQEAQANPDSPAEAPPKNKWHEKFGKGKGKRR